MDADGARAAAREAKYERKGFAIISSGKALELAYELAMARELAELAAI